MAKRIRDVSKTAPRIKDTSRKARLVDPAEVATALGAEVVGRINRRGSPIKAHALRVELARLRASGPERPGLERQNPPV